jgi:hypothetical protein
MIFTRSLRYFFIVAIIALGLQDCRPSQALANTETLSSLPNNDASMTFTIGSTGGNCGGCTFILANGTITHETADQFRIFLAQLNVTYPDVEGWTVYFNSQGGSVTAAMELGSLIRSNNMNTSIGSAARKDVDGGSWFEFTDAANCLSSCLLAFAGGVHRFYRTSTQTVPRWFVGEGIQVLSLKGLLQDIQNYSTRDSSGSHSRDVEEAVRLITHVYGYLTFLKIDPIIVMQYFNDFESRTKDITDQEAQSAKLINYPEELVWSLSLEGQGLELQANTTIENIAVSYRFSCHSRNNPLLSLKIDIGIPNALDRFTSADFSGARWTSRLFQAHSIDTHASIGRTEGSSEVLGIEILIPEEVAKILSEYQGAVLKFDTSMAVQRTLPTLEVYSPQLHRMYELLLGNCIEP